MPTRPARAYLLTDCRRRAALANLRKANAAPRPSKYRLTERRLAANRANLKKARWARLGRTPRERRSEAIRRAVVRHGLYCASLVKSLAAVGERRQSFERHLERFRRAFAPQGRAEVLLVRRAGEAVWRRLRTFRGLARWQARRLVGVIEQFERALPTGRSEPGDLLALLDTFAARRAGPGGLASKALPAAQGGGCTSLSPEQEAAFWEGLGEALDRLFWQSEGGLERRVRRLNARVRRLLRLLERARRGEIKVKASRLENEAAANALASPGRPGRRRHNWLGFPEPLPACRDSRRQSTAQLVEEALERLERLLAPRTARERAIAAGLLQVLRWRFAALTRQAEWEAQEVRRLLLAAAAEGGARTPDQTARLAEEVRDVMEDAAGTLEALKCDHTRQLGWQLWQRERQAGAPATCIDAEEQEAGPASEGLATWQEELHDIPARLPSEPPDDEDIDDDPDDDPDAEDPHEQGWSDNSPPEDAEDEPLDGSEGNEANEEDERNEEDKEPEG